VTRRVTGDWLPSEAVILAIIMYHVHCCLGHWVSGRSGERGQTSERRDDDESFFPLKELLETSFAPTWRRMGAISSSY